MIVPAIATVAGLGLLLGIGLVLANKYLAVDKDPRIERVADELPGANCGGCGFAGCADFAKAVVEGRAEVNDCAPMSSDAATLIASILGIELKEKVKEVAIVLCAGGNEAAARKSEYFGVSDCRAAELVGGADKLCIFGCLGLGSCREVCPFGAVTITKDRLAVVDAEKCTACGNCVAACPRGLIKLVPSDAAFHVLCSSKDKGKVVKGYCTVGCTACKLCSRESKAFDTKSGLSILDYAFDGDIPASAALVCASQTILDTSSFDVMTWVTDQSVREGFKAEQERYKAEQKALKAAKKAKKEKAEKKEKEPKAEKAEKAEEAEKTEKAETSDQSTESAEPTKSTESDESTKSETSEKPESTDETEAAKQKTEPTAEAGGEQ